MPRLYQPAELQAAIRTRQSARSGSCGSWDDRPRMFARDLVDRLYAHAGRDRDLEKVDAAAVNHEPDHHPLACLYGLVVHQQGIAGEEYPQTQAYEHPARDLARPESHESPLSCRCEKGTVPHYLKRTVPFFAAAAAGTPR